MARPASSSFNDHSATVRQLKLLVVALVLSNIGLGLFAFYLLRGMDRQYSDLIGRSVPVLNSLQTLTARSMQAMRASNPVPFEGESARRDALVQQARTALEADLGLRNEILKSDWVGASAERAELQAAGESFTKVAGDVIGHYAAGRIADAARLRESELRRVFDRYIAATTKAADVIETDSQRINDDVSARTGSMAKWVLGVASWPIVALLGLLLLTAIFVLVLMVLFRGREMSDMP